MSCLSCGAPVTEVLDLGDLRLPDFLEPGEPLGEKYPLRLVMCNSCTLLQLGDIVPRDAVIHGRYGFASGLNEANQVDLRQNAEYAMQHVPHPEKWLDIGCNDGTLLSYVPAQVYRVGVDPLAQFARRAAAHADVIISDYFTADDFEPGEFDVVTSTAMFYALPDPSWFVADVREVLAPDGVFVIQQNYALDMLRNNVIDNVIHEHVAYYTVRSLTELLSGHGLEICDVVYSGDGIKGGCFRVMAARKGTSRVRDSVGRALGAEAAARTWDPQTWRAWGARVFAELSRTKVLLEQLAAQGRPAYCYGAGNRGGTLVQLLGVTPDLVPYAVERSEEKIGKIWNSCGLPMITEARFRADHPDYLLVSPWFFRDGFVKRESAYLESGGRMIYPLPHFELVSA